MSGEPVTTFARALGWMCCVFCWLVPFIIIYGFGSPLVGQRYFFEAGGCVCLLVALGGFLFGAWTPRLRMGLPALLMAVNTLIVLLSVFAARDVRHALGLAALPLVFGGMAILLAALPERGLVLRRLGRGLCIIAPVLALYGVLQNFGIEFLPYSEHIQKNVVVATLGHPNYLGSALGPMIFVLAGLILAHPHRRNLLALVAVALVLFCIALAKTRAIWLGLGCGFICFGAAAVRYSMQRHVGLRRVMLLGGSGLGLVAAILALIFFGLPKIDLAGRLASNMEIKSRFYYWDTAIRLGSEHPLMGNGYGMFDAKFWETALARYKSPEGRYELDLLPAIERVMPEHPHSEYIEVYCEQGWIGLAALLMALIYFLWFGYGAVLRELDVRRAFEVLGIWAALIVSSVDAFFGFPWRLPVSLVVMLFLVVSLHDVIEGTQEPADPAVAAE